MDFVYLAVIKNKACVLMNCSLKHFPGPFGRFYCYILLVMLSYVVLIYCNFSGKGY